MCCYFVTTTSGVNSFQQEKKVDEELSMFTHNTRITRKQVRTKGTVKGDENMDKFKVSN